MNRISCKGSKTVTNANQSPLYMSKLPLIMLFEIRFVYVSFIFSYNINYEIDK